MKRLLSLLLVLISLTAFAQQQQEDLRSNSQLAYPQFRSARVLQTFGRSVKAMANIMLKNGALCYVDPSDSLIRQATNASIIGVEFDSVRYLRINATSMGRVAADQRNNQLLCLTTIDQKRLRELTTGGTDLPFFEIDMIGRGLNQFMDMSNNEQAANRGYPLRREYYFRIEGRIYPATYKALRPLVKEELREAFRRQCEDPFWSWRDEASLAKLLLFF